MIAEKAAATIFERHPRKLMMRIPVIMAAGWVPFLVTTALHAQKASDERGRVFAIVCSDHGTAYGDDGYHGHRLAHPAVWTVPYAEFVLPQETP